MARIRTAATLTALLLAGLASTAQAQFWSSSYNGGVHVSGFQSPFMADRPMMATRVFMGPSWSYTRGFRRTMPRAYMSYGAAYYDPYLFQAPEPLSEQDMYLGAKEKGDRALARGDYEQALRQYEDAEKRATRFWGVDSAKAEESRQLQAKAEVKLRVRGKARRRGHFRRALDKGERYLAQGNESRARAQFRDALMRARNTRQAKEAQAQLAKLNDSTPAPTRTSPTRGRSGSRSSTMLASSRRRRGVTVRHAGRSSPLRQAGDRSLAKGDYAAAVSCYARALTRSVRSAGGATEESKELSRLLSEAQRGLTSGAVADTGFMVAD